MTTNHKKGMASAMMAHALAIAESEGFDADAALSKVGMPDPSSVVHDSSCQDVCTNHNIYTPPASNEHELSKLVSEMREEEEINKAYILKKIYNEPTLTGKCIMVRKFLRPQSTDLEAICKKDLGIGPPINETSGDGNKKGINYEIKSSIHAKKSKFNFVQIRPDHDVHRYIFLVYNLYENETIGNAHIFNVPSDNVYSLIVKYGGYAHGTIGKLGQITIDNIKGRHQEYSLRCDPNTKQGKNFELWNELIKYEVEYNPDNF